MGELTRLGDVMGLRFRRMLADQLDGKSSHDGGPQPCSRHPPGCLGNPDPMARDHHRDCVVADRWARACAVGNCQYVETLADKPDARLDCPGHLGVRRLIAGQCRVTWRHCLRREAWGKQHERGGKRGRLAGAGRRLLSSDEREPGAEG